MNPKFKTKKVILDFMLISYILLPQN